MSTSKSSFGQRALRLSHRLGNSAWVSLVSRLIELAFVVAFIWFWRRLPPPGWAVAIMAVISALLSVLPNITQWQKALGVVLVFALLAIELRAITSDRNEAQKQANANRIAENEHFQKIADGLKATIQASQTEMTESQKNFNAVLDSSQSLNRLSNSILKTSTRGLENTTGGEGFSYYRFYGPAIGILYKKGDAPLYNISEMISFLSVSDVNGSVFEINAKKDVAGSFPAGEEEPLQRSLIYPDEVLPAFYHVDLNSDRVRFLIVFEALNGKWYQYVRFQKISGQQEWLVATKVFKMTPSGPKNLLEEVPSNFPPDFPIRLPQKLR